MGHLAWDALPRLARGYTRRVAHEDLRRDLDDRDRAIALLRDLFRDGSGT
jgi:hypothetical protein